MHDLVASITNLDTHPRTTVPSWQRRIRPLLLSLHEPPAAPVVDAFTHLLFQIGDRVTLAWGGEGTVVGVIERDEYARDVEASRWAGQSEGIIVRMPDEFYIHVRTPETVVTAWSGGSLP